MHAGDVLDRPPIASPHRFVRIDIECCAYRLFALVADDEQEMLRHCSRQLVEEFAREVRRRMVRAVGTLVATKEQAPISLLDCRAGLANERNACVRDLLSFLADLLALVVCERREEIGEIAVTVVAPVKLHAVATDQASVFAVTGLLVIDK